MMTLKTNEPTPNTPTVPVLIVGAGLAGLACAKTLQRHGVPFLIVEADGAVGGRVQSDVHHGFTLDRGFQAFNTAYEEARHFLDFKALNLQAFYAGAVIRHNGAFHQVGDPFRDLRQLFTGLFSSIGTLKDKLLTLKLSLYAKGLDESAIFQMPEQPTLSFLQDYGFSETYIQQFFKPFYGGVFLENTLKTSVRKFLYTFKCFAHGSVTLPQAGMHAIPQQLSQSFGSHELWLNRSVVELSPFDIQAPAPRTVTLSDGSEILANFVIFATPLAETFHLLGESLDVPQNATVNLYFSFEGRLPKGLVGDALYLNGEGTGIIQHLCFISEVASDYAPRGKHLLSVTLNNVTLKETAFETASQRDAQVRHELHAWFGDSVKNWVKEAEYVIPHALSESTLLYGENAPHIQASIHRLQAKWNILLASDALDSGSINGALRAGRLTALQLLEHLSPHTKESHA
ncbi:MAG: FAD-dependent oxidoreductase [Vampirovibrionales bacterium]|jgi:protoporphyrinogen oxidase|nr:FAD-dependent oxidoreductase [Vampirovibrionales bacterium]